MSLRRACRRGVPTLLLAAALAVPAIATTPATTTPSPSATTVVPAASTPRTAQRAQFLVAWAAAKLGGSAWRSLAQGLEGYPLYPYLEGTALTHDLATADGATIEAWLAANPDLPLAQDLRRDYLHRLAGASQWQDFRRLYRPGMGTALACDELQARLAEGKSLQFDRDLSSLWQAPTWPGACKPVLTWARDHGLMTTARLWQRIEFLAGHGSGAAAAIDATAGWMPRADALVAKRVALAQRSPATALRDARGWPDSEHTRLAVALALVRNARSDEVATARTWRELRTRFRFTTAQQHRVESALALYAATSFTPGALQALVRLPAAAQTPATREWRVRVALADGDWRQVLAALDALDADARTDVTWRYWRARALEALGHRDAARAIYTEVARDSGYFGFLASDHLDQPYTLCPAHLAGSAADDARLLAVAPLARAFEWHALGLDPMARREWNLAMTRLDAAGRRLAADLASRSGWHDRAIFTLNHGADLQLYDQRFPLAREATVLDNAHAAGIDPAWAYAIIRAESAWAADARSTADARGLMQLLPGTARGVAQRQSLPYRTPNDLYDPAINIPLGTRYLARMASHYNGAPWLASAAYNAGSGNVAKWLAARPNLAPDVFVATIPFTETRAYVRRVMAFAVIYDWRIHGAAQPISQRMTPMGTTYVVPTAQTARKAPVCAAATPAAASSTPHPAHAASAAAATRP